MTIKQNLEIVQNKIRMAAIRSGRREDEIKLVVVTKAQPANRINEAIEAGISIFGENYPEESLKKFPDIDFLGKNIEWHMIGHLQSRKIPIICEYFHYMHSIDSLKIAKKLNDALGQTGKTLNCLLEVNISGETSKFGFPAWNEAMIDNLVNDINELCQMNNLRIQGLMTLPPFSNKAENSRMYFRRLSQLNKYLQKTHSQVVWSELSMGTSMDYEIAIEEGATFLRIGQAIFGPRD